MNKRKYVNYFCLLLLFFSLSAGFGYSVCYQDVTGVPITKLFTQEKQELVGLSENITVKTLEEVKQVVAEAVKDKEYVIGYSCLDYSWDSMRALDRDGQPAAIAGVKFEDGKGHALVLTATKDKNWLFLEPQIGIEVHPVPGGYLNGEKITSVRILVMHWVDVENFIKNPVFDIVED